MEAGEPPDQRIIEQMGQLIGESIKAGVCLDGAGLHRSARRARLNRAGGAERGPYAGGTREDHFGLATSVSENDAIGAGYTHLQSEGFVYFSSQPGMREFFSYWHSGREDRFTTMSREVEAHIDGYARVRREGWSVPVQ